MLIGQYPLSPSMLSKYDSKYYLKHNGNLYSGSIIEMSKRSWKKVLETNLINEANSKQIDSNRIIFAKRLNSIEDHLKSD